MTRPDRFKQVLDFITAHPEQWDQSKYRGDACCFAGHAARMAGAELDPESDYAVFDAARKWLGIPYS